MRPEIGDMIDCRNSPIKHFVLVLGTDLGHERETVMYYLISSRVYAVFPDIIEFFNDCIQRKYARFYNFFKEKDKDAIVPYGRLRDAFFLDKGTDYEGCLDVDSIIVINENPIHIDLETLEQMHEDKSAIYKTRLISRDLIRFMDMIKLSENIGQRAKSIICRNFNEYKKK
ncbi:MAG: hypothetical protein NT077_03335 [Candidatus Taylorbacteria bacterium]|nr:hypothetical protein [Candidatus Taylorbacteria bacterium]